MLAFLIWLPTLYFLPQYLYFLPILFVLFFRKGLIFERLKIKKYKQAFYIIYLITFFSIINYLFGINSVNSYKNIIPPVLYLGTFLIVLGLRKKDLKLIFLFLIIEVFFIYIELFLKINTIYFWQKDFKHFIHISSWYSFRPHGLSSGSSTMGYKLLVLLLLFDFLNLNTKIYKVLKLLTIGALFIVFSRTPIIAYLIYVLLKNIKRFNIKIFILLILVSLFFLFFIELYGKMIYHLLTAGSASASYRFILWKEQFDFICNHIIFGNHSFKLLVPLDVYGPNVLEHAHNSFIEILSTYGIIIFLLYNLLIITFINKYNFLYIIAFIILSLYQYAIFWQISFVDIVFLFILLSNKRYDCEKIMH